MGDGASGDSDSDGDEAAFAGTGLRDEYEKRLRKLTNEYLEEAERTVREDFETQQYHDTLIDICASAFGPEGPLQAETGYRFLVSEPLVELGVKNFDVLIYDAEGPRSIFVECKSSISDPSTVIGDAQEASFWPDTGKSSSGGMENGSRCDGPKGMPRRSSGRSTPRFEDFPPD